MNYLFWALLSIFVLTVFFYAFFYIKGKACPRDVFKLLVIPFAAALLIKVLALRIPDSFNVIHISAISFVLIESFLILQTLFLKNNNRIIEIASYVCAVMAIEVWNNIFFSVIYLVRIPDWFKTLIIVDLFAGFIAFSLITRPRVLKVYVFYLISFIVTGLILYAALAELIFRKQLFGIPLFIGTLLLLLDILCYSARPKWARKKHSDFAMNLTLVASEALISGATLIMLF